MRSTLILLALLSLLAQTGCLQPRYSGNYWEERRIRERMQELLHDEFKSGPLQAPDYSGDATKVNFDRVTGVVGP